MVLHVGVLVHDRTEFTTELYFIFLKIKTHLKCFPVLIVLQVVVGRRCMEGIDDKQAAKK